MCYWRTDIKNVAMLQNKENKEINLYGCYQRYLARIWAGVSTEKITDYTEMSITNKHLKVEKCV